MATRMLQRRGTAAEWTAENPILGDGELGFVRETRDFKVGDGVTAWNDLPFNDLLTSLFDAVGDLLVGAGPDAVSVLPVGTPGYHLEIQPDFTLAWVAMPAFKLAADADATYETKVHAAATYESLVDAALRETVAHAAATYETLTDAATKETSAHAAATYETQAHAVATYETQAHAVATYDTKTSVAAGARKWTRSFMMMGA